MLYLCECFACMCVCAVGACSTCLKKGLDTLELELQEAVSHQTWVLGTAEGPGSSAEAVSALNHGIIFLALTSDSCIWLLSSFKAQRC